MAKGGRYLNKNKPVKKKGKAGKVILAVLLVLAILIGAAVFVAESYLDSLLGKVTQAEFEEKNQDKSYEDLMAEMYEALGDEAGFVQPEGESAEDAPAEEAEEPLEELPEETEDTVDWDSIPEDTDPADVPEDTDPADVSEE